MIWDFTDYDTNDLQDAVKALDTTFLGDFIDDEAISAMKTELNERITKEEEE